MRTYQEHTNILKIAERSDYAATILLAMAPLWRASNSFYQVNKSFAHVPSGVMYLLTIAPLLQNHLKQTYNNKLDQSPQYAHLKQEIAKLYHPLPLNIKKHNDNIKIQSDLLQQLESEEVCVATQRKISKALLSLSISTQAVEPYEAVLNDINQKQQKLDALTQKIHGRENSFLNLARELNLQPINKISNALLLSFLGLGAWSGGAPLLLQMGVDLVVYYGLSRLTEELMKRLSFHAYQNNPDSFNEILWARVSALTKTAISFASAPISKKLNNYISEVIEQISGVERIALQILSPEETDAHTRDFLAQNPTLVIKPGKSASFDRISLVDADNKPITMQTHSGDIHVKRAQWHYKTATGDDLSVYVSARGIPYVSIAEKAPQFETQSQLLNIGFLLAVYAAMGPVGVFGFALLSQVTHVLAATIPDHIQKSVNQYYVDQLKHAYLTEFSRNQTVDVSRAIENFNAAFDLKNYVTQTFSELTVAQIQYVVDAFTNVTNARLNSWQQTVQNNMKLLKGEGVIASEELSQPIINGFYNEIENSVALATASAVAGMKEAASFSYSLFNMIKGINPSEISLGKIEAGRVFQPNYINNVLPELKSYAINSAEQVENRLLAALNEQLNDAYNGAVTALTDEAERIKKEAINYVLKNAPSIVRDAEKITEVAQFFNKQINSFANNFSQQLSTVTCDIVGQEECDSFQHYEKVFTSDIDTDDQKFSSYVKDLNNKASHIFKLTLQQNLSPAQKAMYEKALQSLSVDFAFASNIAGVIFGSQMAGKIQAVGEGTIGLIATLSSAMKMGSIMTDIGSFAAKIMPALAIVNAVFQIFSIFGGGESAAQQTDKMIQQYMQVLEQQLHVISEEVIDVYKEVGQLGSMMQTYFAQLFKNLKFIVSAIRQGEEITQELMTQTQMQLRALGLEWFVIGRDMGDHNFRRAQSIFSLNYRSRTAINNPLRNATLQDSLESTYRHAVIYSVSDDTRTDALMVGADQSTMRINAVQQAEANDLGLVAPENSIQSYQQIYDEKTDTQNTIPPLDNGVMWRNGVNEFTTAHSRFASDNIFYSTETMISDMIRAGMALIQFGLSVRHSTTLWKKIIGDYNATLTEFVNNAPAFLQNALGYYVTTSQSFMARIQPLQQKIDALANKLKASHYSSTAFGSIFRIDNSGNCQGCDTGGESVAARVKQDLFDWEQYINSVVSTVQQFSAANAFVNLFNRTASISFPTVFFNAGPIQGLPLVINMVWPYEVWNAWLLNKINVYFSYVMNGIITANNPTANIQFTGTYTLNGKNVTFFNDVFPYTFNLTGGYAGYINTSGSINSPFETYHVKLCENSIFDPNDCMAEFAAGSQQKPLAAPGNFGGDGGVAAISEIISACEPQYWWESYHCLSNPTFETTYGEIATTFYHAILTYSWISNYSLNATSIQNTAQWENERAKLKAQITSEVANIAKDFIQDMNLNPNIPAYQPFSALIRAMEATYNLVVGFLHFGFADYTKGTHSAHENPLNVRINPWKKSNGAHFEDQQSVQVNAIPGNSTTMHSQFELPLQNKNLHIVWSPFNNAQAKMGLQLGNKTLVEIDPSVNSDATYYTRIVQTHPNQYEITTALNQFDGVPVKRSTWNTTETQAKLGAFVQSEDAAQGIRISNATSLQKNTTVDAIPAFWKSINTLSSNQTRFEKSNVTFFNTNQSDPVGYSELQTKQAEYVMNTEMYVAWEADAGVHHHIGFHKKPYNMTVGINLGEQKGVAEFKIDQTHFHSNTVYYSRITVTPEKIMCITSNKDGVIINNSTQKNNFVTDAAALSIRISKSNAPNGRQSVSIQPIQIVGFEASILPEPMSANNWQAQNSAIVSTPNGLTITTEPNAANATLISKEEHILRDKEIWMKWKANGDANITLQLSGNPVATFESPIPGESYYTRVVVFNNTVEITTANEHYDVNSAAVNVTQIDTPASNSIGTISWVVSSNTADAANFTLAECMIQDAANTILSQKGAGLMSSTDFISALLSTAGSPQAILHLAQGQIKRVDQVLEILQSVASQPDEIDPDNLKAMKTLFSAQKTALINVINKITMLNHDDYPDHQPIDFTKTGTTTPTKKTQTISESQTLELTESSTRIETVSDSKSEEISMSRSESESENTDSGSTSKSKTNSRLATNSNSKTNSLSETHSKTKIKKEFHDKDTSNIKTIGIVLGSLIGGGAIGVALVLSIQNRRSKQRRRLDFVAEEGRNGDILLMESSNLLFNQAKKVDNQSGNGKVMFK